MKRIRDLIQRLLGNRRTRRALMIGGAMGTACLLCGVANAAGGGHHGGEPHINWWTWDAHAPPVGWFIVDFILFVALLVYFVKKPLAAMFQQRHDTVKEAIASAQAAHQKAKAHHEEYSDKLGRVDEEIRSLVGGAKAGGAKEHEKILLGAKDYAQRLQRDSVAATDQETQQAHERLRHETVGQVMRAAQELLTESITPEDQDRLLEQAITELEKGAPQASPPRRHSPPSRAAAGGAP